MSVEPKKKLDAVLSEGEIIKLFFNEQNGFGSRATGATIHAAGRSVVQRDGLSAERIGSLGVDKDPEIQTIIARYTPQIEAISRDAQIQQLTDLLCGLVKTSVRLHAKKIRCCGKGSTG